MRSTKQTGRHYNSNVKAIDINGHPISHPWLLAAVATFVLQAAIALHSGAHFSRTDQPASLHRLPAPHCSLAAHRMLPAEQGVPISCRSPCLRWQWSTNALPLNTKWLLIVLVRRVVLGPSTACPKTPDCPQLSCSRHHGLQCGVRRAVPSSRTIAAPSIFMICHSAIMFPANDWYPAAVSSKKPPGSLPGSLLSPSAPMMQLWRWNGKGKTRHRRMDGGDLRCLARGRVQK